MGQPVTVVEKPSARPGVIRYETNRNLTGMGHERFGSLADVQRDDPASVAARMLFERGGVDAVHVHGNVVTVHLADGAPPTGIRDAIEELFLYYREGVEVAAPEGVAAD